MIIETSNLDGVLILKPEVHKDHRGFFIESYNKSLLEKEGIHHSFIQDNHSFTKDLHTIRGLHYQLHPKAQTKLIRVCRGAILDLVVDMREDSPSFGKWISYVLSEDNLHQLLIPKGFAHGFCTLTRNTHVHYKVDEYYDPRLDRGIIWNDQDLQIDWPTNRPILSEKDAKHPTLRHAEINF